MKIPCEFCGLEFTPNMLPWHRCEITELADADEDWAEHLIHAGDYPTIAEKLKGSAAALRKLLEEREREDRLYEAGFVLHRTASGWQWESDIVPWVGYAVDRSESSLVTESKWLAKGPD